MTTTTTWQISAIDCVPQQSGKTNVAQRVHWRATSTDGEYTSSTYGTVSLSAPTDNFIEFDALTEAQAIEWTKAAMGTEQTIALEASLDRMIENQKNPPIVTPQLPWVTTTPVA
jgi:hypothetical protein